MPADVRMTLTKIVLRFGGFLNPSEAEKFLSDFDRTGRYIVESWA